MNQLAPARSSKKEFENGSTRSEGGANLAMAASVDVRWVTALISHYSKSSNVLFVSPNTSTTLTKQFVV